MLQFLFPERTVPLWRFGLIHTSLAYKNHPARLLMKWLCEAEGTTAQDANEPGVFFKNSQNSQKLSDPGWQGLDMCCRGATRPGRWTHTELLTADQEWAGSCSSPTLPASAESRLYLNVQMSASSGGHLQEQKKALLWWKDSKEVLNTSPSVMKEQWALRGKNPYKQLYQWRLKGFPGGSRDRETCLSALQEPT